MKLSKYEWKFPFCFNAIECPKLPNCFILWQIDPAWYELWMDILLLPRIAQETSSVHLTIEKCPSKHVVLWCAQFRPSAQIITLSIRQWTHPSYAPTHMILFMTPRIPLTMRVCKRGNYLWHVFKAQCMIDVGHRTMIIPTISPDLGTPGSTQSMSAGSKGIKL